MRYQVLARKWRPNRFEDVIGQAHITRSLQNAIKRESLGSAYVLTGTRGVGKTTVARIFAKALRCENQLSDGNPCNECRACQDCRSDVSMNVLEIDGASNNGVDHIRELIANVHCLPTSGRYKIYIIDEVHMVTTAAFNALLKTLEEPPAHVIFIFATTEPRKLLDTVLSRCQRFDFRSVATDDLEAHVKKIAISENIVFENEQLIEQVCIQGKGSVRDTLSLLEQVLSFTQDKRITEEILAVSLGLAKTSVISELVSSILVGDAKKCSAKYRGLIEENIDVRNIVGPILDRLFEIIEKIDSPANLYEQKIIEPYALDGISNAEVFWIYEALAKDVSWVLESIDPVKVSEIVLQKLCLRRTFFDQLVSDNTRGNQLIKQDKEIAEVKKTVETKRPKETSKPKETPKPKEAQKPKETNSSKSWEGFLEYLYASSPVRAGSLEQGNILKPLQFDNGQVQIAIGFDEASKFYLDYFQDQKEREKLISNLSDFFDVASANIDLQLEFVDENIKQTSSFQSRNQIKQKKEEEDLNKKKEEFITHPVIMEAQKIFNAKIDKVVVDKPKYLK